MADRLDYCVLASFFTREEAEVAASSLRADGVDSFVGNAHHSANDWWSVIAFGGLQVMVPSRRLQEARTALQTRLSEWAVVEPEEVVSRRDRWRVWVMGAMALTWLIVPMAILGGVANWMSTSRGRGG